MRHSLPIAPQFYVTAPQACPYLDDRQERKLFAALQGDEAQSLNNCLSKQGFRRSQNVLYRPTCLDCAACLSARVEVKEFFPNKSQKRTFKTNQDISRRARSPWATDEQFELFKRYLDDRHASGGLAEMEVFEFAAMIEETPVETRVIEYVLDKKLVAACLTDLVDDGLSMVYSFYDPALAKHSLGTYVVLDHIKLAKELDLNYVYLGYWVPGSSKMGYKSKFSGLEVYHEKKWKKLKDIPNVSSELHPLNTAPVAEQVSELDFPGSEAVR